MRTIPVGFADAELEKLRRIAEERNAKKEKYGVKEQGVDNQLTGTEKHYLGLKGECAVSKLLAVDFSLENMLGGDDGHDLVYKGLTVDVKYSQLDLKIKPGGFKADIVILVKPLSSGSHKYAGQIFGAKPERYVGKPVFQFRNVLVMGWIDKATFEDYHIMKSFAGNPEVEFMLATDLRSMADLKLYADTGAVTDRASVTHL